MRLAGKTATTKRKGIAMLDVAAQSHKLRFQAILEAQPEIE